MPRSQDLLTGDIHFLTATNAIDVMDHGAIGDGVTDDTAAIQAALNVGTHPVYLPPGTFKISSQLDLSVGETVGGGKLIGAGRDLTKIVQDTENVGVLKLWGAYCRVSDMTLDYTNAQGIVNTDSNALEFHGVTHSVVERIKFHNCNRGLFVPQIAVIDGANWVFSTSLRDLYLQGYSNSAMDLSGYSGGISGNVMSNVYCLGRDDAEVKLETNQAIVLGSWSNGVLEQINVESTKPTEAIYLNTCDGLVLNGIHFEQVEPRTDYGGMIHFAGGNHIVNNVDVAFCQVSVANLSIVRVSGGSPGTKVHVRGVNEANNTLTGGPNWRMFSISGAETGTELYADLIKESDLTDMGFSGALPSSIKRANFTTHHLKIDTQNIISGSAAPVLGDGTWVVGDIVFNNAPAAGGKIGWVCTSGGDPGTWKTWGAIDA